MHSPVVFNSEIIAELRHRVIAHNERVGDGPRLKLGQMKGLYKRWYAGRDPHLHALRKVDEHLAVLEGEAALEKARRPFNASRHPRGRGGEFRPTDGPPLRSGSSDPALLDAAQTQVIPETRYSTFGPPIAGATGIVGGAIAGSTARLPKISFVGGRPRVLDTGGTAADRLLARGARFVGSKVGRFVGSIGGAATISPARAAVRGGIGLVNRGLGTRIPRPAPTAGAAAIRRAGQAGRQIGGTAAHALVTGSGMLFAAPAGVARALAERVAGTGLRGRIAGHGAGAAIGALIPGLMYGAALAREQRLLGPYEDTLWPRRVRKIAGHLFDDPDVLAKQSELLTDDLAKANWAGLAGRIIASLRSRSPGIVHAAAAIGPSSPAQQAAEAAFAERTPQFLVGRLRAARAAVVGSHVGALAAGGAGLGAIAGAAAGTFNAKHPRDPRGRFAEKGRGAVAGAKLGAAIGAGLGVATGLIAARGGHAALVRAAIQRLRGQSGANGENLLAAMQTKTERIARAAHAQAYVDALPARSPRPAFAGSGREHEQVVGFLKKRAMDHWMAREGRAMQGGAKAWYRFQLDRAFDAAARRQLGQLGGIPTVAGGAAAHDLANTVDVEKLTPQQKTIWDNLISRRDKASGEIDQLYEARAAEVHSVVDQTRALTAERQKLLQAVRTVPDSWDDLKTSPDVRLGELRAFAKARLDHDLQAKTAKAGIEEIEGHVGTWLVDANQRLARIDTDILELPKLDEVRNRQHADLDQTELRAIRNPFSASATPFFRNRPAGADTQEGFERIREAVGTRAAEPFVTSAQAHVAEANEHLNALVGAQEAALEARLPKTGAAHRAFEHVAPVLAGRMHQAAQDYALLMTARRESLSGTPRVISDWLHAHQDPRQAWSTTRKVANAALRQGRRVGGTALRNWKTISSIVGPLTAVGAIDLSQPGSKKFRINPKHWKRPQGLGLVTDWPDAVRRPDEALFGVSYRDRAGREKFLHGIHITSKDGAHRMLPFGADVEAVKNSIRGGGGGSNQPRPEAVHLDTKAQTDLDRLKQQGQIKQVGPKGFEFPQRIGGEGGKPEQDARDALWRKHLKWMETPNPNNQNRPNVAIGVSTNKRDHYYNSLRDILEGAGGEAMGRATRAGLLTGTAQNRGVFANPNKVYQGGDKEAITNQLIGQSKVHTPLNSEGAEDEYTQVKRALWLASEHLGLSDHQKQRVLDALDRNFTNASSKEPPLSADAARPKPAGSATASGFEAYFNSLSDPSSPRYVPPASRRVIVSGSGGGTRLQSDEEFRNNVESLYTVTLKDYRKRNPESTDAEAHRHAAGEIDSWINSTFDKMAPIAGMAKRTADIDFAPARPGATIAGAAGRTVAGRAAPAGTRSTLRSDLRASVRPANTLGQLGTYGLSQAAWDGIGNLTAHLMPGGGMVANATKFGLQTIGSVTGSVLGTPIGQRAGRILGDTSQPRERSNNEATVGGLSGAGAQIAYNTWGHAPVKAAASSLWSRGAAVVGRAIGGAAEGAETGAEAGTLAEPGGGTLAGGAIGAVAGLVTGAVTGALTDEGAGILYRHLHSYGEHVPKMAASKLGYAGQSAAAGTAA